jgi:hypothetical protein
MLPQASVTDLNAELKKARSKSAAQSSRGGPGDNSSSADILKGLISKIPLGGAGSDMSRDLDSIEKMRDSGTGAGGKRPEAMSPQELHAELWKILTFRDSCRCFFCFVCVGGVLMVIFLQVMKKIEITIGDSFFFMLFSSSSVNILCCRENPRFGFVGREDF